MSAWSVKTRRAPSRHCEDARDYAHTTMAVHDNEYTPALVVAEVRFLALPSPPASSTYPARPILTYAVLYRLVL